MKELPSSVGRLNVVAPGIIMLSVSASAKHLKGFLLYVQHTKFSLLYLAF